MKWTDYKGVLCVIGSFLIHFSLGTIYTFGNISSYIASYLKFVTKCNDVKNDDMVWIIAAGFAFQGLTMSLGGFLNKKIGPRYATLIGCWLMSLSVMLTYFSIKVNLYVVILTYGALFGSGVGIAYSVAIASAMKWYPTRKGLIIGIVVAGFGLGSLVFNQIQTVFINPENLSPNVTIASDKYFDNVEMLQRVPNCFLLIGGIYAFMQLIGCLLQFTPAIWEVQDSILTVQVIESESAFNHLDSTLDEKNHSQTSESFSQRDMSLKDALKTKDFWILWLTLVFIGTVNVFATSLYKTFGQSFINDDYFFALVGSIAAIFNAMGRIFWGQIVDRFSYKRAMRCIALVTTVIMGTFYCCELVKNETGAKVMHSIWVCALLCNICGTFSLMPAATAKLFGMKNVATIYGTLFTANATASVIGALSATFIKPKIGYLGIFEIGAGMAFVAFILTFMHKRKNL